MACNSWACLGLRQDREKGYMQYALYSTACKWWSVTSWSKIFFVYKHARGKVMTAYGGKWSTVHHIIWSEPFYVCNICVCETDIMVGGLCLHKSKIDTLWQCCRFVYSIYESGFSPFWNIRIGIPIQKRLRIRIQAFLWNKNNFVKFFPKFLKKTCLIHISFYYGRIALKEMKKLEITSNIFVKSS